MSKAINLDAMTETELTDFLAVTSRFKRAHQYALTRREMLRMEAKGNAYGVDSMKFSLAQTFAKLPKKEQW